MPRETFLRAVWRQDRKWPLVMAALLLLNLLGWIIIAQIIAPKVEVARRALSQEQQRQRQQRISTGVPMQSGSGFRRGSIELERFRERLLNTGELTIFLGELYMLATENGLDIDRISYQPEPLQEQDMLRYTLNFSVTGTYGEIKKFIYGLEHSERIIILDRMSLRGGQAEQDQVALQLQLTTYFLAGNR